MKGHKKHSDALVGRERAVNKSVAKSSSNTNETCAKNAKSAKNADHLRNAKDAERASKTQKRGVFARIRERVASRFRVVFSDEKFTEKAQTIGAYSAAFMAAFLVALVSASTFTPLDNSEAADTINVTYNSTGYYINMATSGNVNMEIQATPDGQVAVASDTVNVKTNSKTYKIYVSMNSSAANGNRLNLGGSSSATSYFTPTSGSATAPAALDVNSWGWALANPQSSSNSVISSYGFDTAYNTTSSGGTVNDNSKFAAMPLMGNEALIAAGTVATTAGTNYNVYYGAKANTALTSGTYQGTVLYTAVGEASGSAGGEASIAPAIQTTLDPDTGSTYGKGQEVTIATSMYTSAGLDLGNVSATIGGKECTNVQTSTSSGGTVNITCNAPEALTWGKYDVVATFTKFDRAYSLTDAYDVYVPYSDMASAAAGTYTMQSFTAKTCEEMNLSDVKVPKAYNTDTGTGSVLSGDTVNTSVPEITLYDAREGTSPKVTYRVRKLADGNCWMTENLRLKLSTVNGKELTSETSDINYNMDTGKGLDGATTTPRTISNPLKVNGPVLGTYSTDASTGVISWKPYKDSQTTYSTTWGSPYSSCSDTSGDGKITASECTLRTSGGSQQTTKYFEPNGSSAEVEHASATIYTDNVALAEFARSYDNEGNSQSGTGSGAGNLKVNDGDGNAQYYGTYYNWYAATAGSGTWALSSGDAKNSVCPRNWSLPHNSGDGSWYDLFRTNYSFTANGSETGANLESDAARKAPFSVVYSGVYSWYSGSLNYRGSDGYYWSSHGNSAADAHNLYFYSTFFYPQAGSNKIGGFTVRCVVR